LIYPSSWLTLVKKEAATTKKQVVEKDPKFKNPNNNNNNGTLTELELNSGSQFTGVRLLFGLVTNFFRVGTLVEIVVPQRWNLNSRVWIHRSEIREAEKENQILRDRLAFGTRSSA
jgi:hypothetical protein